jgi:tetratricopeptide (TPR) repeat protein
VKKRQSSGLSDKELYEKGRRLTQDGRHGEAIEALNSAIDKNPLYAEAYFARGACHYALGSYRQAENDLDAAALLGCRDAQFWSKFSINASKKSTDNQTK